MSSSQHRHTVSTGRLWRTEGSARSCRRHVGLPAGTEVFSADNHISLADDIFYERFPEDLKDKAPRIWYEDGAYMVGRKGQSSCRAISAVC